MTKKTGFILALFTLVLQAAGAHALGRKPCEPVIQYQGSTYSIKSFKLPYVGEIIDFSKDSKSLQTAGAMAQILDMYQCRQCELLNNLKPENPAYAQASAKYSEANMRLTQLAMILSSYQTNASSAAVDLSEWIVLTRDVVKDIKSNTSDPKIRQVNYEKPLGESFEEIRKAYETMLYEAPQKRVWNIIRGSKNEEILARLKEAVDLFSSTLQVNAGQLSANIFMPGGDGYFYSPDGFAISSNTQVDHLDIKIPRHYGVVSDVFEWGKPKIFVMRKSVAFTTGLDPASQDTQAKARLVLLPAEDMPKVRLSWLVSIPVTIKSGNPDLKDDVIAVLNVSSRVPLAENADAQENLLNSIYYESSFNEKVTALADKISAVLTLR